MTKKELLNELEKLKTEAFKFYQENGNQPYEAGQYAGVKWAIDYIRELKFK